MVATITHSNTRPKLVKKKKKKVLTSTATDTTPTPVLKKKKKKKPVSKDAPKESNEIGALNGAVVAKGEATVPTADKNIASPNHVTKSVTGSTKGMNASTGSGKQTKGNTPWPTYFLFVDRLPYKGETEAIQEDLKKLLWSAGTVKKLYRRKNKGFGHMNFQSKYSLDEVLEKLNNVQYQGRTLRVEGAKEEVAQKAVVDKSEHGRQVYIGNLPNNMTKEIIKSYVGDKTGVSPNWVKLILKSGAAFLTFTTQEDAVQCANKINGHTMLNKKITAELARPPPEKVPQFKEADPKQFEHKDILVGPISASTTDAQLTTAFERLGCTVSRLKLLFNPNTGKFKECARILFADLASAQTAYKAFHNKMLYGRKVQIEAYLGFGEDEDDFDVATTVVQAKKRVHIDSGDVESKVKKRKF